MAERPHRFVILGDYAKTIIAIGGALLAICVTFSANLPSVSVPVLGWRWIAVLWVCLSLTILFAIWMLTRLIAVLRLEERIEEKTAEISAATPAQKPALEAQRSIDQAKQKKALSALELGANLSYGTLFFAVVSLVVLGFAPKEIKLDLPTIISRLTNETAQIKKVQPTQIIVTELKLSPSGDSYSVTLSPGAAATPWQVEVDAKSGSIRSLH